MLVREIRLARAAFNEREFLINNAPKVIFCGRSNVGKSSLINFLVQRRNLARTSSDPGKTASVNYYILNDQFYLVDLPGYGYARLSEKERWRINRLMERFFTLEKSLRFALLLIDARIGFLENDCRMLSLLEEKKIPLLTLLTKSDKLSFNQVLQRVNSLEHELNIKIIPVSVKIQQCRNEIFSQIKNALEEKRCTP